MAGTLADSAALVARVWHDPGVPGFRGRVTYRLDAAKSKETVVAVDSPERLHGVVQEWLDRFGTGSHPSNPVEPGPVEPG